MVHGNHAVGGHTIYNYDMTIRHDNMKWQHGTDKTNDNEIYR